MTVIFCILEKFKEKCVLHSFFLILCVVANIFVGPICANDDSSPKFVLKKNIFEGAVTKIIDSIQNIECDAIQKIIGKINTALLRYNA